jgi:transposase
MMRPDAQVAVFVCVEPVDMRKQAATLALIVEQTLKRNIFEPALYVFSNERRDRIKIVYWQRNGLCLWSKRLEGRDRFIFPRYAMTANTKKKITKIMVMNRSCTCSVSRAIGNR